MSGLALPANPDMLVHLHANIVSMILNKDYVAQMTTWQEVVMAIILCLLNGTIFVDQHENCLCSDQKMHELLQLIQLVLYSALMVMIFAWYSFKFNVTLTLAAVALVGDVYEVYIVYL